MVTLQPKDRIMVALDVSDPDKAARLVEQLSPHVGACKYGLEYGHAMEYNLLAPEEEADAIESLRAYRRLHRAIVEAGTLSFKDGKLHDIANTVEKASICIAKSGFKMFNVHCLGGPKMMEAAAKAAKTMDPRPLVIGVTVLTSLSYDDFERMGIPLLLSCRITPEKRKLQALQGLVMNLATLAKECGLDGVVCSPQEARLIREQCGPDFLLVTPGIRSKDAPPDDQKRTMTAGQAIREGADIMVIGRPITGAPDPVEAAKRFTDEIAETLKEMGQ
ncbi:MAG: orotidine-5'-phosphate decarboxylase [Patescibacteria group bacterium]